MFEKLRVNAAANRLMEEQLYEAVSRELAAGVIREGLMAKALADTEGSQERARALYIRYRVQSIIDEGSVQSALRRLTSGSGKKGLSPEVSKTSMPTSFEAWLAAQSPPIVNPSPSQIAELRQAFEYNQRNLD